jgi:Predicted restriction endonuclease
MSQLQVYFERFLCDVRGLKQSSADHYQQALRTVSRYLRDSGLIALDADIYSVESLTALKELRFQLLQNEEFVNQDETGNRMYSAGLNRYIEFAELQWKQDNARDVDLTKLDVPVPVPTKCHVPQTHGWNRDRIIVKQVIKADGFQCEISKSHTTFISRCNDEPYLEGYHLIPISRQDRFDKSLDVYANIIGLCPNCHRQLHFGRLLEVREILKGLYDLRVNRLAASGLVISKDEFLTLALG